MAEAKIALVDIETAPNLGWVWGIWEQNVIEVERSWYILSFAWKWLGEKKVTCKALPDYPGFKPHKGDDSLLVRDLWKVLDEADIIISHNGDRFDLRKSNARFIVNGLKPPSPYKSIDTLKIARKNFSFDSNKLDELGRYLDVGRKLPHTGKHLWFGAMSGDPKSWALMRRYNEQDVALLERVYLKLRSWSSSHPLLTNYSRDHVCPTCQSHKIQHRGFAFTKTGKRQRMQCVACGAWSTDTKFVKVTA